MTNLWLYRLAGLASGVGGALGGIAHAMQMEPPPDPGQLAHYASLSQVLHLTLFTGGLLLLLGMFGQFAFQTASRALELTVFVSLFLGILLVDLLHCVLEFTVFPPLIATVPYATPGLAEMIYHSAPLAAMQQAGGLLLLAGVPLAAFAILRSRLLPNWPALPLAVTAILLISDAVRTNLSRPHSPSLTALYASMALAGAALFRASFTESTPGGG